jgi:CRP/FNR family transcriptional regulator, nitrogen fixation regulation protein
MDMNTLTITHATTRQARGSLPGTTMQIGDRLELPAAMMSFGRNEEIYGEGEPAEFVYKVVRGAVRTARYLEDGRRQIGAFHLAGDIFGCEAGDSHRFSAEAISDCEVLLVRRSALDKAVAQDANAARQLWTLTSARLEQLQDQLMLLGRMTASERVEAFLLDMSKRKSSTGAVDLPMSRNDIADYLGLTIETVSRTFSQLKRSRAISLNSSRNVVLRNRMSPTGLAA